MNTLKRRHVLKKAGILIISSYLVTILASCISIHFKRDIVFTESPPSVIGELVPVRAGIDLFEDIRTEDEKRKMAKLGGIDEEVTTNFTNSLRYCQVFSDVKRSYKHDEVDVVLKGKIENFRLELDQYITSILMQVFGTPLIAINYFLTPTIGDISANVGIEVSVEHSRTGQVIARYFERRKFSKRFNTYTKLKYDMRGLELNDFLREISGKIIEQIFTDRDKILESAKPKRIKKKL